MNETSSSKGISPGLQRVANLAKANPQMAFTTLAHHLDLDLLREAYRRTRKDGAVGIDGIDSTSYAKDLQRRLRDLLDRAKSGRYHAPAVRRAHLPKGDGQTRPIGIPTFEDKVLQRAVATVLEAVYEQDFLPCSYGFRPGRSAHQALSDLWSGLMSMGGGWVLEADIKDCFGSLDHAKLREILGLRIRDGVLTRLIGKWLNAGVLDAGQLSYPTSGTPQGGVVSPLLANVYLHAVLDTWFETMVKPRMRGRAFLIRYADDFVLVFAREDDARRAEEVLPKRFGKYGLRLHPDKTRLLEFRPPQGPNASQSFDLLGFTHFWSKSLKGNWVVKRKTIASRLRRSLRRVSLWCRASRHRPVAEQHRYLCLVIRGHCGYFGITGNSGCLVQFREGVRRIWRKWLRRRSNSSRRRSRQDWWNLLCTRYPLPSPRAIHSVLRTT